MKKAKSTTLDERLKIVMECLANDKNYGAMALKYQCSYQQVRNWVKRYEEMGSKSLEDRRGRRVGSYQVVHLRKNYVIESLSLKEKILIYK